MIGSRGAVLTLADQFVSSATNFAIGVMVARAGGADALGAFGIAFLIWLAVLAVSRALISEPMTVGDATGSGELQLREGMLATLLLGAAVAGCLAAAGGLLMLTGASGVAVLALAPWIPSLLLQDYWRGMAFRLQRPDRALTSDGVFAVAQGSSTFALFVLNVHTVAAFIASWGIGATAGALIGLFQSRVRTTVRGGLTHLRSLWTRSRWFLAESGTAFLSDQGYLLLLPVLLGTAQFGVYRAGASLVGPAVIIFLAGGNIGLPECVRRLRQHGRPGLMAYTTRLSVAVLGLTTAYCVLVAIFAEPMLRLAYGTEFTSAAVITQLVAAQYVLFAIGFGCGVALKAAGQMRRLWAMRTAGALVSITAMIVLASSWRLIGAGLAGVVAGAAYTVGIMVAFQRMRGPGPADPTTPARHRADQVRSSAQKIMVHTVNTTSNVVGDDVVSRWIRRTVLRLAGATIPSSSSLHGRTYFSHPANLRMGNRCFINGNCYLDLKAPIILHDDVVVGHGSTIVTSMHVIGPASRRAGTATGRPVVLRPGVWLGACTVILPGVTIGAGSIVAAGAVVTTDVPVDVIVAGVPAKVVRNLAGESVDRPPVL
ncbi:MAG: hypothetical protein ACRDQY_04110 [Pseudonocardiaceae bacterium]